MEENLLGHLLKANDSATTRAVEQHLLADPVAIHDLARLRAALVPLEAAREDVEPPADLWVRTVARVAEHVVATEGPVSGADGGRTEELIRRAAALATAAPAVASITPAPPPPADPVGGPARRWNVAAVVGLTAAVLALVMPAAVHVRQQALRVACQDTMRDFYEAASGYSDTHAGRFPQVPDGQAAASAADALKVAGYLPEDVRFACPAGRPTDAAPVTLANYAYTLGYRAPNGELKGLERQPGTDLMPILADAPRRDGAGALPMNHRHGQNVLFVGGNVRFCTANTVGVNGDDIYCNADGKVGAGLNAFDAVLGRPEERP